ncbi:hypothetical protein C8R42DRAFT_717270 [Lentinula raphanica]|nr:hypothetical protein C8R42DRAFT_717267 [Lentinula raphanica]KAJ3727831.1 hypothetical protein C8R42DRAFT_717270 [Lentinula raphanica]
MSNQTQRVIASANDSLLSLQPRLWTLLMTSIALTTFVYSQRHLSPQTTGTEDPPSSILPACFLLTRSPPRRLDPSRILFWSGRSFLLHLLASATRNGGYRTVTFLRLL